MFKCKIKCGPPSHRLNLPFPSSSGSHRNRRQETGATHTTGTDDRQSQATMEPARFLDQEENNTSKIALCLLGSGDKMMSMGHQERPLRPPTVVAEWC
ncbi:hypothetical protein ZHAS_00021734 [Anopheles sinensis]|uniref:Uncharacterized protein n=1 Tax=Anopheles sinensis TaxID=74873 RepID=A0A084WTG3_ANOSI|nr:hypothetical protein ZHAS_00021734 [Anopheles sinensis]